LRRGGERKNISKDERKFFLFEGKLNYLKSTELARFVIFFRKMVGIIKVIFQSFLKGIEFQCKKYIEKIFKKGKRRILSENTLWECFKSL